MSNIMESYFCLCVLLIIKLDTSLTFFANKPFDDPSDAKTHFDITRAGLMRAIDKYIVERKNITSYSKFFGADRASLTTMINSIGDLARMVTDIQDDIAFQNKAFIHCSSEEIENAHIFVKQCRKTIPKWKKDLDGLRKTLAVCLYTMQSFYSNTNWIEMFGEKVYEDFGTNDLMEVVTRSDEDTCTNVENYDGSCQNNIIVHNKLTSGYFQGRGITKPARPLKSVNGKCSHGGPYDSSRTMISKCGINKDSYSSKYSPHHYLHEKAFSTAVAATKHFLFPNNGSGIFDVIGDEIVAKVFHVKMRTPISLGFAIDYTGSMSEEISAVKQGVIQILTTVIGSGREPEDYVLSMFHDPVSYNKVFNYTDGYEMIREVEQLHVVGGHNPDCPEYAITGMLNAIERMRPYSPLLVFTDADAKDEFLLPQLKAAVKAKHIKLELFITYQCPKPHTSRRRKRSYSFFEQLAQATGGTLHRENQQYMGAVLHQTLQRLFPSSEVIIDMVRWTLHDDDHIKIPVDSTVTVLKIRIIGSSSLSDITLFRNNGSIETFTSRYSSIFRTSNGETIISLQHPKPGHVSVRRNIKTELYLNVTAQSPLSISVELYQENKLGKLIRSRGEPILGQRYYIHVIMNNLEDNGTLHNVFFVAENGSTLLENECTIQVAYNFVKCIVQLTIPKCPFQIKVDGTEKHGYNFTRVLWQQITPTNVELILKATNDDAVLNAERELPYEIIHYGSETETYIATIKSSKSSFLLTPSSRQHIVTAEDHVTGVFKLKPTIPSVIFSYTIDISKAGSNRIQQTITKKLLVTDIERPVCSILNRTGWCGLSSLNTANCSLYKWTVTARVSFSGTLLKSISTTGLSEKHHDNITALTEGPLMVYTNGDCCSPYFQLTIVDVDNFISQCNEKVSNGEPVKSVEVISIADFDVDVISSTVGIAIGIGVTACLSGVVIGIMLIILKLNKRKLVFRIEPKADMSSNTRPTIDKKALNEIMKTKLQRKSWE